MELIQSKLTESNTMVQHGPKVKKGHNSKTCKTHGEGHQEYATRSNTMGGSKTNKNWVAA